MSDTKKPGSFKGKKEKKAGSEQKEEQKSKKLGDLDSVVIPTLGGKQKQGFTVPSISSSQKLRDSVGKNLIGRIGEFELKIKQGDQEKKRQVQREKEKKENFVQVMTDLGGLKKETLQNQDKILDLDHELKLKRIETRHLNTRITITFMVIFVLAFLFMLQLIMALTGHSPTTLDITSSNTNGTISGKSVSEILEDAKKRLREFVIYVDDADDEDDDDEQNKQNQEAKQTEFQKVDEAGVSDLGDSGQQSSLSKNKHSGSKLNQIDPNDQPSSTDKDQTYPSNNLKQLAYLQYLQNLYKKTYQLHRVLVAGASNLMEMQELSYQTQKVQTYHNDVVDEKTLKEKIYFHFSEIYSLQLMANQAYKLAIKIDSLRPIGMNRTEQNIQGLQSIHNGLVTPQKENNHLPMLSKELYLSPAKPVGLKRSLQSMSNKFKQFSTREQYKAIEAAIQDYKSAIKVDRTSFFQSCKDSFSNMFGSVAKYQNGAKSDNSKVTNENNEEYPPAYANSSVLISEKSAESTHYSDDKLEFSDDL